MFLKLREKKYLLVLFWLISTLGICQQKNVLALETQDVEIKNISFYADSLRITSPSFLNLNLFRTDTQNIGSITSHPPFNLWFMIDVKFTSSDTTYNLVSNALEKSTLFTQNTLSVWQGEAGGFYNRLNDHAFVFNLKAQKNTPQRLFFLVQNKTFNLSKLNINILPTEKLLANQIVFSARTLPFFIWNIFLMGTFLLISFYAFFQYALNKNLAYLLYGLFSFFCLLGFLQSALEIYWSNFLYDYKISHAHFEWRLLFMVGHTCQVIFYLVFFNLKPQNFNFYKYYIGLLNAQIILISIYTVAIALQLPNNYLLVMSSIYSFIILFGGMISLYFIAVARRGTVTNIILIGTISLAVCYFISIFLLNSEEGNYPLDRFVFSVGTFVEIIFFWISLAVRDKETERDMQRFKTAALSNEIKALRSQMNPHFIFNCLNSLNLYILENHIDQASDYLQRFSKLIRLVLENSRLERIPLKNEIEALKLYMDLETMRFKNKLRFFIEIDESVEPEMVNVPPLLFQPFIENSIWHGLMHKLEGGSIHLKISQPDDNILQAEIIDDGIGRAAASEIKSKSATLKKSFGMKVTNERIAAINQIYNIQAKVEIIDLFDEKKLPNGTKVIITIPV